MTIIEVITAITSGVLDDGLERIETAARERARYRRVATAATLAEGTEVRFTDRITPALFRGMTGTVVRIERKTRNAEPRVVIHLSDENQTLAKWGSRRSFLSREGNITAPASVVEVVR